MKMETINNTINKTQRLNSVDLARGFAVFFMICVHVLHVYSNPATQASVFGQVVEFLGGPPAAPVFMMLMGLSFAYSNKNDLRAGILRGLTVFASGYLLNLLRGFIPIIIAQYIDPTALNGMTPEQSDPLNELLIADILQFAGIALIIMAVLKKLNVSRIVLIGLAFILSMVSPFLWGSYTDIPVLSQLLDLFAGDKPLGGFAENMISFPVFPWLAFPLIGMAVGKTFTKASDLGKSHRQIGIMGTIIMIIGLAVVFTNPEYHFNDYYHSRQGFMIFMIGFVLLWLYICHLLASIRGARKIFGLLYNWSKNVTSIYFIQWILIAWCIAIFDMNSSSLLGTLLIMLFMMIASDLINIVYIKVRYKNNDVKFREVS